jgi:hypothetical protein
MIPGMCCLSASLPLLIVEFLPLSQPNQFISIHSHSGGPPLLGTQYSESLPRHRPVLVDCCYLVVSAFIHSRGSFPWTINSFQFLVNVVAQTLCCGGLRCDGHRYQLKWYIVVVAGLCSSAAAIQNPLPWWFLSVVHDPSSHSFLRSIVSDPSTGFLYLNWSFP